MNDTTISSAVRTIADSTATSPLVSICIPSYRGAAYLPATIESVLAQSYGHFELLIVDDASPDDTVDVVARYDDPRLRLIRNESNLGPQGNWNRCLEVATGKYYKLLPQDDLLAPDSLAQHVAILEADGNEKLALVFGSRLVIDQNGRSILPRGLSASTARRIDGRRLVRRCVSAGTNLIGEPGNGLMRRSLALRLGAYDAGHPYMVDLDFWFRALAHGDGYYTAQRSSCFRISQGSWSVALRKKQLDDFKGFVEKYARDASYGITRVDMATGFAKARINTLARALIYRSMVHADAAALRQHEPRAYLRWGSDLLQRTGVRRSDLVQFMKFIAVGVVNTAFSYAIYAGLLFVGLNFAIANLLSLVVGVLFSFKTQSTLVFGNFENRRIFRFALVWAVLYGFNIFMISRFIVVGFDPYISGALSIPFSTVLSYLAQKFFVFRVSRTDARKA